MAEIRSFWRHSRICELAYLLFFLVINVIAVEIISVNQQNDAETRSSKRNVMLILKDKIVAPQCVTMRVC